MSIISFEINDFQKMLKAGDTFELGYEYVITLNPDDICDCTESRMSHKRCFVLRESGKRIMTSDPKWFTHPYKTNQPAVCQFIRQKFMDNCSLVYFKFMSELSFIKGTYPNRFFEDNYMPLEIIGEDSPVAFGMESSSKIITNNLYNISDITTTPRVSTENNFSVDNLISEIDQADFVIEFDDGHIESLDKSTVKKIYTAKSVYCKLGGDRTPIYESVLTADNRSKLIRALNARNNSKQ